MEGGCDRRIDVTGIVGGNWMSGIFETRAKVYDDNNAYGNDPQDNYRTSDGRELSAWSK
jgi:hypothetical protein